jgi:Zn-dependent protease with chaperone function
MRKNFWRKLIPCVIALLIAACKTMPTMPNLTEMQEIYTKCKPAGNNKDDAVATTVHDKSCNRIVQPFTLMQNVYELKICAVASITEDFWVKGIPMLMGGSFDFSSITEAQEPKFKQGLMRLNWLPMTAEVMYGQRLHDEVLKSGTILERQHRRGKQYYAIADKMLEEILAKVGEDHDYTFQLFILKSDKGNAVARPGGFLYVDEGLLKKNTLHPKAYFALAHEVAHVLQRHETKELQGRIIDSIDSTKDLVELISGVSSNPDIIFKHIKLTKDQFTRHHMDQELQSDACSVKLLHRTFMNNQKLEGAIKVFQKDLAPTAHLEKKQAIGKDQTNSPLTPIPTSKKLLVEIVIDPINRHPTSEERINNLNQIYQETISKPAGSTVELSAEKP